ERARLPVLRFTLLQVLVSNADLFFERIELWIPEDFPPLLFQILTARLCCRAALLFVGGWDYRGGPLVIGSYHARRTERDHRYEGEGEQCAGKQGLCN